MYFLDYDLLAFLELKELEIVDSPIEMIEPYAFDGLINLETLTLKNASLNSFVIYTELEGLRNLNLFDNPIESLEINRTYFPNLDVLSVRNTVTL